MIKDGTIETSVVVKECKIPNYWSLGVSKKYKRNAILGNLLGGIKFQVILNLKNSVLRKRYLNINFPYNFIQSTFNSYQQKCESLIPNW